MPNQASKSNIVRGALTQLQQAKLDERKGAGHFYKPVKAIAVICAAVGIFTSGMLSQGPTTRQPQKAEVANKSPSSSQGQQPTSSPPRSADVPTNKFASPTERVLPTTPQPTKPEARLPKPEKPGDPPAVADNGFRTPGGIGGPLIPVPVPQVPKPGISGERSLPPAATSPPTKPEARTPGGIGGPLVPVPFPNPHTGSVAPPPLGPPKEIGKPPAAISQVAERLLDLSQSADARRVQQALIELGLLAGPADGIWGPRSRKALQDFRGSPGPDQTWDAATQKRLFASVPTQSPPPSTASSGARSVGAPGIQPHALRLHLRPPRQPRARSVSLKTAKSALEFAVEFWKARSRQRCCTARSQSISCSRSSRSTSGAAAKPAPRLNPASAPAPARARDVGENSPVRPARTAADMASLWVDPRLFRGARAHARRRRRNAAPSLHNARQRAAAGRQNFNRALLQVDRVLIDYRNLRLSEEIFRAWAWTRPSPRGERLVLCRSPTLRTWPNVRSVASRATLSNRARFLSTPGLTLTLA